MVRFVSLEISATGVLERECAFSSRTSSLVHSRRFRFLAFFAIWVLSNEGRDVPCQCFAVQTPLGGSCNYAKWLPLRGSQSYTPENIDNGASQSRRVDYASQLRRVSIVNMSAPPRERLPLVLPYRHVGSQRVLQGCLNSGSALQSRTTAQLESIRW